jgi:hypothetical protein
VEWIVEALEDSVEVTVSVTFSGVDLQNLSNGEFIRANAYQPTLQLFDEADTLFRALTTLSVSGTDADIPSRGVIETSDVITINNVPKRFAIGFSPVQTGPTYFVPNAFAPDGVLEENRVFRAYYTGPPGTEILSVRFSIFNSFNKEVHNFSASGGAVDLTQSAWDGKLPGGQEAPEGVYYYKINLVSTEETISDAGSLILVK